jgi:hypothetical protein
LGLIKQQGINGGPIAPDVSFPMIATRDIADVTVRALRQRDWHGVIVRELLGRRDLTFAEATRILGERIQYADFTASLVQMGISANVAGLYGDGAPGERAAGEAARAATAGEHDADPIRGVRRRSRRRSRQSERRHANAGPVFLQRSRIWQVQRFKGNSGEPTRATGQRSASSSVSRC